MDMQKFNLVVTRHQGLVDFLREENLLTEDCTILTHVTDTDVLRHKDVIGVLPHHMSSLCHTFSELVLEMTPEDRGQDLPLERVKEIQRGIRTYKVQAMLGLHGYPL